MEGKGHKLEQMPELVKPSLQYKDSFLDAAEEVIKAGEGDAHFHALLQSKSFDEFLAKLKEREEGVDLEEGRVPQTELWLVDKGEFIGLIKIRHRLNDILLKRGGHIGYMIRPSKRKMNYGNKILAMALPVAKSLGIDRALLTCKDTNIGSAKIIENSGGILENKITDGGERIRRYWIDLRYEKS